jgi:hypothetical protein
MNHQHPQTIKRLWTWNDNANEYGADDGPWGPKTHGPSSGSDQWQQRTAIAPSR